MTRPRLIVTRQLPASVEDYLQLHFDTVLNATDRRMGRSDLQAAMKSADALLPTIDDPLDREVLGDNPRVRVIANFGVGYNHIDLEAAKARGITVCNTPDVLTDATADIALYLILASTRRTRFHNDQLMSGNWRGFKIASGLGMGLVGKRLGIIGMGRIGQATARRARALGMEIIYHSRSEKVLDFPAQYLNAIEDVMKNADVISLHMPGGQGAPIVTSAHIAMMKQGAHLINTARGDVIDQEALIAALEARQLGGVGLDVFADEPHVPQALMENENAILLPHIGSATLETRTAMGMMAAENLHAFFDGRDCPNRVV